MTKAVLVLDEMPKGCVACPCFDIGDTIISLCNVKDPYRIRDMYVRPSWCPIKEMPEKRILPSWQVNNTNYGEEPWFSDGWNACLEEIENETTD